MSLLNKNKCLKKKQKQKQMSPPLPVLLHLFFFSWFDLVKTRMHSSIESPPPEK